MTKRNPANQKNPKHLAKVRSLGCIVCFNMGRGGIPAVAHHIRTGVGRGQKASDLDAIPLCPSHHTDGGYGVAYHSGPFEFEQNYGTELELLHQTRELLGVKYGSGD